MPWPVSSYSAVASLVAEMINARRASTFALPDSEAGWTSTSVVICDYER